RTDVTKRPEEAVIIESRRQTNKEIALTPEQAREPLLGERRDLQHLQVLANVRRPFHAYEGRGHGRGGARELQTALRVRAERVELARQLLGQATQQVGLQERCAGYDMPAQ